MAATTSGRDALLALTPGLVSVESESGAVPREAEFVQAADQASPLELAVVWVEKARKGSVQWFDTMPETQMQRYRIRKRMKPIVHVVMFLYLALALFEQPSWCLGDEHPCANSDAYKDMPSSGLPVLHFQVSNSLEIVFLLVLILRTWLRWTSLGGNFSNSGWHLCLTFLLCLATLDCVVGIFNIKGIVPGNFRLARLCRPLIFMCCFKNLRQAVARVCCSIPKFMNVLASLAISLLLFTWIGIILFASRGGPDDEGQKHFRSWGEAMASMWILFTTANNPDVWLPAYHKNRWSFIFFVVYLVLSLYLINNVLLAAVYDSYKDQLKDSVKLFFKNRKTAIEHAFHLLAVTTDSGERMIDARQWQAFFLIYCDSRYGGVSLPGTDHEKSQKGRLAFQALDCDESGGVSLQEFRLVVDIFHDIDSWVRHKPSTFNSRLLKRIHHLIHRGVHIHGFILKWDDVVDVLIFADILITFVCTMIFLSNADSGDDFTQAVWRKTGPWFWTMVCFTTFYFIETNFKLWVLGVRRFFHHNAFMNWLDVPNVYVLMVLQLVCLFGNPTDAVVRIYVLCRIARVLRLLVHIRALRHLAEIMMKLAPTYRRLTFMLLIVFYLYATIGEQVFGGLVRYNNETRTKLAGSDYDADNYYDLNFNDFLSGMVVLFVLMIVNNWYVISDGFWRLSNNNGFSEVFFVSFFVVVNLIVLNILMALILDCLSTIREDIERQEARKLVEEGNSESDTEEEEDFPRSHLRASRSFQRRNDRQYFRRETVLRKVLLGDDEDDDMESSEQRERGVQPADSAAGVSLGARE